MSKFVRIQEMEIRDREFFFVNVDLVASANLFRQDDLVPGSSVPGALITLHSADNSILAEFYLDTYEEGKRWVRLHFGVQLASA